LVDLAREESYGLVHKRGRFEIEEKTGIGELKRKSWTLATIGCWAEGVSEAPNESNDGRHDRR